MNDVKKIRTICNMCQTACSGIVAHVKDGKLLKLEGDPECPPSYGKLCVKGLAGTLTPENPNRILKPMLRTNPEKGLGVDPKWKEITWEEAYDEIVPRMKRIRKENSLKLMLSSFDYPQYYHLIPWCIAFGAQYYVGAAHVVRHLSQCQLPVLFELLPRTGLSIYQLSRTVGDPVRPLWWMLCRSPRPRNWRMPAFAAPKLW